MSARITIVVAIAALAAVGAPRLARAQQPKPRPSKPQPSKPANNTAAAGKTRLLDAYQREFAFLESEKRTLEQRLAEQTRSSGGRIREGQVEIARLQSQVVATASEAERLEELMLAADRDIESLDQSEDVVGDILVRASASYEKLGVKLPDADPQDRAQLLGQLSFSFHQAATILDRLGQVRVEQAAYFDRRGEKVAGPILRIGNIAAYGLVDGAQGPLAPAGQDQLKLWPADGGSAAAAMLARGDSPDTLPIFFFESLDKLVEQKRARTPIQVIEDGGTIGWVIVGLGMLALLMILGRAFLLARASLGSRRLLGPVLACIERGRIDEALAIASRAKNSPGRVLTATLENLGKSRPQLEDVVAEAVLEEQPLLSRFGSAILVLAAVSPLLGLLGTVTGMITTFEIITEFGTGNPKLLSGGISVALITTELGLIVAIPALLVGHMLSGWSERIRDGLDAAALSAVNRASGLRPPPDDDRSVEPVATDAIADRGESDVGGEMISIAETA